MTRTVGYRRLIYFTSSFPFGYGERWKYNDLQVFKQWCNDVDVVPLSYGNGSHENFSDVPEGVTAHKPLFFSESEIIKDIHWFEVIKNILIDVRFRSELLRDGNYRSIKKIKRLVRGYIRGTQIAKRMMDRGVLGDKAETTHMFFFWGLGAAEAIPWISREYKNIVVGYHNFDLYEERYGGIPFLFRKQQLKRISLAVPCSQHGAKHLNKQYPKFEQRIISRCLGVEDAGESIKSDDGILRVVSCSFVRPVKRLNLIVDAIARCKAKILWTHIGGDDDLEDLKIYAKSKLTNTSVTFNFLGSLSSEKVREFYRNNCVDVFLSVSKYEGLPVSMMEVLSAGIPIIGTDVGGVSEIVDDKVGILLEANPSVDKIANAIDHLATMSEEEIKLLRNNARKKFLVQFQVPKVIEDFASKLFFTND